MKPLALISGYAHVAMCYGLEEAIFLDSIMYWYRENRANNRNYQDGRWWTFNSVRAFTELFPYWSANQVRRIINRCQEKGALLSGNYNEDQRDRTMWYTPSDALLVLYGMAEEEENSICEKEQMDSFEVTRSFTQTDRCNKETCNTHVLNPIVPFDTGALFDRFWAAYPKKKGKEAAKRAWRKLKPDIALCRVMAEALDRQRKSKDWLKEGGAYIPYPSTWLNGRRWEDEEPAVPGPPDGGGERRFGWQ